MTTDKKKMNVQSDNISYPIIADYWRQDFINLIPQTKRRNEVIGYAEKLDWERIGDLVYSEIKIVMGKISIPQSNDSLRLNSSIVEAIILSNFKKQLHYLLLHDLSNINKEDSKSLKDRKIKGLIQKIVNEVSYIRSIIEMLLEFGSLKWIKDSDTKLAKIDSLIKKNSKLIGKKYNRENLDFYRKIYARNDAYVKIDGGNNYRRAAFNVIKISVSKSEKIYKSFNKFKNKNNIHTLKDFDNFLSTLDSR